MEQETRFTVEGLVIKVSNVGESDRLVTLFTKEMGIIRAFAAGAKNIKSKKSAATSLLTYSSFTILNKKGTYRIYEATPISQFFSFGEDIEILTISQYFCELGLVFGNENVPNVELLRLLLNSLHFLTKEKRYGNLIKAITEFRVAVICGYAPNLVACKKCACFESDIMFFNLSDGSVICRDCGSETDGIPINKTVLTSMRHIAFSEFSKLYSFDIPNGSADILSRITGQYLQFQSDVKFKTLDFLNT